MPHPQLRGHGSRGLQLVAEFRRPHSTETSDAPLAHPRERPSAGRHRSQGSLRRSPSCAELPPAASRRARRPPPRPGAGPRAAAAARAAEGRAMSAEHRGAHDRDEHLCLVNPRHGRKAAATGAHRARHRQDDVPQRVALRRLDHAREHAVVLTGGGVAEPARQLLRDTPEQVERLRPRS